MCSSYNYIVSKMSMLGIEFGTKNYNDVFVRKFSAYMKRNDNYNFVIVNAKRLVAGPWYIESSLNVVVIGKYTAELIEYLVSRGLDLSKVHLIGHSLGAHMAANVGAHLKSGNISRLTGKRFRYI